MKRLEREYMEMLIDILNKLSLRNKARMLAFAKGLLKGEKLTGN